MVNTPVVETIIEKLRTLAVPMDSRDFSNEEYNRVFPRGTVDTPIGEGKPENLIVAVVVDIQNLKIAISAYKRKRREVIAKIKKADGIVYIKDNGGSLTNGGKPPPIQT
jgi:hypothetical protein